MVNPNTMGDVIREIVYNHGEQTLLNTQLTLSAFGDLAPNMKKEKDLLRAFLQCGGAETLLQARNLSGQERRNCMDMLIRRMQEEQWVVESSARYVCSEVYFGITGRTWDFDAGEVSAESAGANLDVHKTITIHDPKRAAGKQISVDLGSRTARVYLPDNLTDGQVLCFRKNGRQDSAKGRAGDLYLTIRVPAKGSGKLGGILAAAAVALLLCAVFLLKDDFGKLFRKDSGNTEQKPAASHVHTWQEANCTTPQTCASCGETSGSPVGHQWLDATYREPQTCTVCSATQGESLSQPWRREPLETATGIISVSPGGWSTYALTDAGRVYAIGRNQDGQMNVSHWSDVIAVSGGDRHVVVLFADGTVDAIGRREHGQCDVSGWHDMIGISAGVYCTVGICEDGTVRLTGKSPQTSFDVSDWENIVEVDVSDDFIVGLRCDGTVVSTGLNNYGQRDLEDWTDIISVAVGEYHTVGLRSDGTVVAAGKKSAGACDVSGWEDIVAISAGAEMTVGLRSDGTVVVAGDFTDKQKVSSWLGSIHTPERWTDIVQIAARYNQIMGLTADGYIVACGFNTYDQCVTENLHVKIFGDAN